MLYVKCREQAGRDASPTAAIIDSQSVKSARKRGATIDRHGYDAGKKIKGKKRHLLVDTQGLLLHAIVHAADMQDRDGGVLLMATCSALFPFLRKLYADAGYQGPRLPKGNRPYPSLHQSRNRQKNAMRLDASPSCQSDGSSNAPSLGSIAVAALPRIGSASTERPSLSCDWASIRLMLRKLCKKHHDPGQTLRKPSLLPTSSFS